MFQPKFKFAPGEVVYIKLAQRYGTVMCCTADSKADFDYDVRYWKEDGSAERKWFKGHELVRQLPTKAANPPVTKTKLGRRKK